MSERKRPDKTCTNHCTACGSHFSSLAAFDAHRLGSFKQGTRYCEEPADLRDKKSGKPVLEPLSVSGVCALSRPPKTGVTVWTTAGSRERVRAVFSGPVPARDAA